MGKFKPVMATVLPLITNSIKKGNHWFIVFESPLSEEQMKLLREINLGLQDPRTKFLFSYDFLPAIPEKGVRAPLRQGSRTSTTLRIMRAGVDGYRPSLKVIVGRLMPKLEKFITTDSD